MSQIIELDWLQLAQQSAQRPDSLRQLQQISLRRNEHWRYAPLADLAQAPFYPSLDTISKFPEQNGDIVFVNGVLQRQQLPPGCKLVRLPKPLLQHADDDALALLAHSFAAQLFCLQLDATPEQPIRIQYHYHGSQTGRREFTATSLAIKLAPNVSAQVIEVVTATGSDQLGLIHQQLQLGSAARLDRIYGHKSPLAYHLHCGNAELAGGALVNDLTIISNEASEYRRQQQHVLLAGKEAKYNKSALALGRGASISDWLWLLQHAAPNTISDQLLKTALNQKGKLAFRGLIHIDPKCPQSEGYQYSRGLLLDQLAQLHSVPELEIYTDDVKCSHGSVSSPLREDEIFYLSSRGLTRTVASNLLLQAYLYDVIARVRQQGMAESLITIATEWLADCSQPLLVPTPSDNFANDLTKAIG